MLRGMRILGLSLLALVLLASPIYGQGTGLSPQDVVRRDALLEPGMTALKKGDAAAALGAFQPALSAYPKDTKVLLLSGEAAMASNQNDQALLLFQRALAEHPASPLDWDARFSVLVLQARLAHWTDFDQGLAELKAAKEAKNPELDAEGFLVDLFDAGGKKVKVIYYPQLAGKFHTLYRFLLPKPAAANTPSLPPSDTQDRCANPNFQPYLDVESDDADQAFARKGQRVFSLDTYPASCSQGLIKFYQSEPKYEDVRAEVLKNLTPKPTKP